MTDTQDAQHLSVSAPSRVVRRRRERQVGFKSIDAALRDDLCATREDPGVRAPHLSALLAFAPGVERIGTTMWIPLEHRPSALWLANALTPLAPRGGIQLRQETPRGIAVGVRNPQIALGPLGFRNGQWKFGNSPAAALGLGRGALHAAGEFSALGLSVACASASLMLALAGALNQIGVAARPTEGRPRVVIVASDVAAALRRLEVCDSVAASFQRLQKAQPLTSSGSRS